MSVDSNLEDLLENPKFIVHISSVVLLNNKTSKLEYFGATN